MSKLDNIFNHLDIELIQIPIAKQQIKDLFLGIIEMPIESEVKQFNGIELNAYMYAFKVLKKQLRQKVEEL
jgi:hypothetical protein